MLAAPRFTVVIPTYNRAHLIRETLDSVLAQTFADREIVVVDDGSTDETPEVLAAYGNGLRFVRQENRGVAAAWNRGIRESRGELVAFLASDDRWEPRTLEKMERVFAERPEVGLVSVMARVITADGALTNRIQGKRTAGSRYTFRDLLRGGWCSWFAVRRELLDRIGGYDEKLRTAEECEFCFRLFPHTEFHAIREPLLLRRLHDDNLTVDRRQNATVWLDILEELARRQPEAVARYARDYRRALGKEHLRLGRELLADHASEPRELERSRHHLRKSIATYPWFLRAYAYLAWSRLAPRAYASWRRVELRRPR